MSGNEIAALIVAITSLLAAIFAGLRNLRGDKFKRDVEASAALLTGYTTMVSEQRTEITALKNELRELKEEMHKERVRLKEEHRAELAERDDRIDELGAQVYALQHRPPETRQRRGDDA